MRQSFSSWRSVPAILGFLLLAMLNSVARADGFIIIREPPRVPNHFAFAPLEVTFHRVTVDINDQVAVTKVDEEFRNPNPQALEGTYIFPLPEGAHIDQFTMDINGRPVEAELLPADKARALYEDTVRKYRDPALLEYAGRDAFKVHIFPIEANSDKHVQITYTQLLKNDSGLMEYTYPLNTEKFSSRPLRQVSVKVNLHTTDPIKSVYCPSHSVEIRRDGDDRATIGFEQSNVRPDTDFKVIFSRKRSDVGIDLMTYKTSGEDGYFLLLASPGVSQTKAAITPKDVCFVLDTSGSMAGPKIDQAKKALNFCLANLNDVDRSEIVRFSTDTESLFQKLVPANGDNIDRARNFVKDLKAIGGTAIDDALHQAMTLRRSQSMDNSKYTQAMASEDARPFVIVFLTDGQPTIGETREDPIVQHATDDATNRKARIFCFGIGMDVNTHLLDRIADSTKATSAYVLEQEDIEVKVSNFFTKIKEPVLSNVELTFSGDAIRTSQIYPNAMPDLFKGDTLMAFGRYSGSGASAVKITGTVNGERREFVQDVNFTGSDSRNAFIPRLWSTRRVGWLLDEIRIRGESSELKDEVVRLARQYGIVTPYTAYLILEDERGRRVPLSMQTYREFGSEAEARDRAGFVYHSMPAEAANANNRSGDQAVGNALSLGDLKQATNEQQSQRGYALAKGRAGAGGGSGFGGGGAGGGGMGGYGGRGGAVAARESLSLAATTAPDAGYRMASNYAQQVRVVNGRSFYQNQNTWTDATAQAKQSIKQQQLKFASDDYFALLKAHPEAAAWLSLGDEVDVVIDDTLYSVRN